MEFADLFNIYSLAFVARQRAIAVLDERCLDSHTKVLLCEYVTYLGKILELTALLSSEEGALTDASLESKMLLYATKECSHIEDELNLRNICFLVH